jgi:eukaryotic-like serine/threonine-protein kinase
MLFNKIKLINLIEGLEKGELEKYAGEICKHCKKDLRFISLVGIGGESFNFLVNDKSSSRICVLKIPRLECIKKEITLQRFFRSFKILCEIKNDCFPVVYYINDHVETPFVLMEYIEGKNLKEIIEKMHKENQASNISILTIFLEICHIVAHLHKQGVIHRDIKPENIMVDKKSGTIKLIDFGFAKSVKHDNLTREGAIIGTYCFSAPEQLYGHAATVKPSADVYSLGKVLYFMLTNKEKYDASELPFEFLSIIPQMLEENPEERIQTVSELINTIQELIKDAPEVAITVSTKESDIVTDFMELMVLLGGNTAKLMELCNISYPQLNKLLFLSKEKIVKQ